MPIYKQNDSYLLHLLKQNIEAISRKKEWNASSDESQISFFWSERGTESRLHTRTSLMRSRSVHSFVSKPVLLCDHDIFILLLFAARGTRQ